MNRFKYFFSIGFSDSHRVRLPLLVNVFIVAGICLPALLLLGLETGLVRKFRRDILKSPTARQIQVWATRKENTLTSSKEAELEHEDPDVFRVIPDITRLATLSKDGKKIDANLNCTKPGDPFLDFYNADVLKENEAGIVISKYVADELGIAYQQESQRFSLESEPQIQIHLSRMESEGPGKYEVKMPVRGIFDTGGRELNTAYLERNLMDALEDFVKGRAVPALGLPGSMEPPDAEYDGYLAFATSEYSSDDLSRLRDRGFSAKSIEELGPSKAKQAKRLYGLLKPHSLCVYWIHSKLADEVGRTTVNTESTEIEKTTNNDDIVIGWTEPIVVELNGKDHRLLGISLRTRWLRKYFKNPSMRFSHTADLMSVKTTSFSNANSELPAEMQVELTDTATAILQVVAVESDSNLPDWNKTATGLKSALRYISGRLPKTIPDKADAPFFRIVQSFGQHSFSGWTSTANQLFENSEAATVYLTDNLSTWEEFLAANRNKQIPLAIVTSSFAAHATRYRAGDLEFDATQNSFVPGAVENEYLNGRVYTSTLDDVPRIDGLLRANGYTTMSSRTRVLEMQSYAGTLNTLVRVVLTSVLIFGGITVAFVFSEATSRKRGSIGIMRIMGMPSWGIFCFVFVRALVVGLLGGVAASLVGMLIGIILTSVGASCEIRPEHISYVFLGAFVCCIVGVTCPAWHAAKRLDPVDAIAKSSLQT